MDRLKPCPFCGGNAEYGSMRIGVGESIYYVRCSNDAKEACFVQPITKGFKTEQEAIEAWNRRSCENG